MILKQDILKGTKDITIKLEKITEDLLEDEEPYYMVSIDGVIWFDTELMVHATVIYELLKDHITEYYHYEKITELARMEIKGE